MTTPLHPRAIWSILRTLVALCVVFLIAMLLHAPASITTPLHFCAIACVVGSILVFFDESRPT